MINYLIKEKRKEDQKMKTLNDLDFVEVMHRAWHEQINIDLPFDQQLEVEKANRIKGLLRQEAIKDLIGFYQELDNLVNNMKAQNSTLAPILCKADYCREKFNITEEELPIWIGRKN